MKRTFIHASLVAAIAVASVPAYAAEAALLEYDTANRLRRVKQGNVTISYVYDGLGNLDAQIVDDGEKVVRTDLLLDESGAYPRVIGALGNDGTRELYAYGPSGVAMVRKSSSTLPAVTYRALTDELGTLRGLADTGGNLAGRVAHDPWGRRRASEGVQAQLGFAGEFTDAAQFVWLRARHYAPILGRFLQRDTFVGNPSDPQSFNRYAYAVDNPLTNVDPSGHEPVTVMTVLTAIGFVVGTLGLTFGALQTGALTPTGRFDPSNARVAADNSKIWQRFGVAMISEYLGAMGAHYAIRAAAPVFARTWLALQLKLRPGKSLGTPLARPLAEVRPIESGTPGTIHSSWLAPDGTLNLSDTELQLLTAVMNPNRTRDGARLCYGNCGILADAGAHVLSQPRGALTFTAQPFGPSHYAKRPYPVPTPTRGVNFDNRIGSTSKLVRDEFALGENPSGVGKIYAQFLNGKVGSKMDHAVTVGVTPSGEIFIVDFQRAMKSVDPDVIDAMFPVGEAYQHYGMPIPHPTGIQIFQ